MNYENSIYNYNVNYRKMFTSHDPITQVRYVRKLFDLDKIDVDNFTRDVLLYNDLEFMNLLEKQYGSTYGLL